MTAVLVPLTPRERPAAAAPQRPATPSSPAPTRSGSERVAPLLLGGAGVVMLPALGLLLDRDRIGGWGLAGILPVWAWVGIGAVVLACVLELCAPDPRARVLGALTAVLALCSTGLASVVEPGARLAAAWLHLGFVETVARDGHVPAGVDARFSWAGFFSQWAWIDDAAGGLPLDDVLRWTPPAVALLWTAAVYVIAQRLLGGTRSGAEPDRAGTTRAPWAAAWLFLGLNWIEQDYFSPQATAMVLVLAVLVLVTGPLATRGRAHPDTSGTQVLLCWGIAAACLAALAVTHQLTPFALLAQLALLALAGRVHGGRGLVLVGTLAVVTWLVLGGQEFWQNQLMLATGDVGDASGSVASALTDRLVGDPGQLVVKAGRVLLAGATVVLGTLGAWLRWRRTGDVVWLPVALVAAPLALVQSYGGEVLLRVLLYGLPLLAVLGVEVLRAVAHRRGGRVALAVGMLGLFAVLVVVRGGNDAYVALRPSEIALTRTVLDAAPAGSTVLPLTGQAPVQVARVGEVVQTPTACGTLADDPVRCTLADRPWAVWSLPTMDAEGVVLDGRAPGWSRRAMAAIAATGQYRVTVDDGSSMVLERSVP